MIKVARFSSRFTIKRWETPISKISHMKKQSSAIRYQSKPIPNTQTAIPIDPTPTFSSKSSSQPIWTVSMPYGSIINISRVQCDWLCAVRKCSCSKMPSVITERLDTFRTATITNNRYNKYRTFQQMLKNILLIVLR